MGNADLPPTVTFPIKIIATTQYCVVDFGG